MIPIPALFITLASTTVGFLASASEAPAQQASVRHPSTRQARASVVSCDNVIASTRKPDRNDQIVLGSFGAPPQRIQRGENAQGSGWKYFAKSGVEIKAGVGPVTVSVATTDRNQVAISWGNGLAIVEAQRFPPCGSSGTIWRAYAGGFYLRSRTACVPLFIKVGARSKTIHIGVGRNCT
jgi:hypothetical protein